ncbi:MAG TPA: hypothetical protein PKJ19_13955 [Flavobacteriales bacterium]|nr:hypothetical protein [Flavobacteriales bacterium]HNU57091.1 hypothetical protein [Flavobacteriales bacterium]
MLQGKLTIIAVLLTADLAGQVLTVLDLVPVVGDTFYMHGVANDDQFEPGPEGTDVVWDHSDLMITTTSYTRFEAIEPASAPHIAQWPTSDLVLQRSLSFEPSDHTYKYFDRQELGLYEVGEVGPVLTYDQGEPDLYQVIPAFFGVESTSPFCYTSTALDVMMNTCGELTQVLDGAGTLLLPTGSYEDVLRTRHHRYNITNGSPEDTSFSTIYRWWQPGRRWPLMEYNYFQGTNDVVLRSVTVLDVPAANALTDASALEVAVLPNPFSGRCTVRLDRELDEAAELVLHTADGRVLMRKTWPPGAVNMEIPDQELPSGPLFFDIRSGRHRYRGVALHIP